MSMGVINAPWRRRGNIDSCARNCRQREEVANTSSPSLSRESITRTSDGFSLDNVDATRCKLPATPTVTAAASVKVSPSSEGWGASCCLGQWEVFCCGSSPYAYCVPLLPAGRLSIRVTSPSLCFRGQLCHSIAFGLHFECSSGLCVRLWL